MEHFYEEKCGLAVFSSKLLEFGWLPGLSQDISQPTNPTFVYSVQCKWILPFSHLLCWQRPFFFNLNWVLKDKMKWLIFGGSPSRFLYEQLNLQTTKPHTDVFPHVALLFRWVYIILKETNTFQSVVQLVPPLRKGDYWAFVLWANVSSKGRLGWLLLLVCSLLLGIGDGYHLALWKTSLTLNISVEKCRK